MGPSTIATSGIAALVHGVVRDQKALGRNKLRLIFGNLQVKGNYV